MRYYVALIIRDAANKFLTVRHIKKVEHQWRFPGGKIEAGELPIVAAARELQEELGVIATGLNLFTITEDHFTDNETWAGYFFEVTSWVGDIAIQEPHKHSEMRYMTVPDLRNADAVPEWQVAYDLIALNNPNACVTCGNDANDTMTECSQWGHSINNAAAERQTAYGFIVPNGPRC